MRLSDLTKKLLSLAQTLHCWIGALGNLDREHRMKVALYADEIAATVSRAADALVKLEAQPNDSVARRAAMREFGRITGYLETIVGVLQHHLDGRKVAGVKRRLEQLGPEGVKEGLASCSRARVERLFEVEGYFRALADSLRA